MPNLTISDDELEELREYWRERKRLDKLRAESKEIVIKVFPGWIRRIKRLSEVLLVRGSSVRHRDILSALGFSDKADSSKMLKYWRIKKKGQKSFNSPKEIVLHVPPQFVTRVLKLAELIAEKRDGLTKEEVVECFELEVGHVSTG